MQISNAFALTSIRRFKKASKSNMAEWFREFLRTHPSKQLAKNNHLSPLKKFKKYMKNALRQMRPKDASGVEFGKWRLPCGLKAVKAWALFEKLFAQLRAQMMPAVTDVAPTANRCKGSFKIVPSEPKAPADPALRRRRQTKPRQWEKDANGCLMPVLEREVFIRRPMLDGSVVKGVTNRRDKRPPGKPNAVRM